MKKTTEKDLTILALKHGNEIYNAARTLYTVMPISFQECFEKVLAYVTNNDNETVINAGEIKALEDKTYDERSYEVIALRDVSCITETSKQKILQMIEKKEISSDILKKIKTLRTLKKKLASNHFAFYISLYDKKQTTYEELKNTYRDSYSKDRLKRDFLSYISNTQIDKRKQSKRYTVSRDLDKEVYYETEEGRLARIKGYIYKKYMKKGMVDVNFKAYDVLKEGVYVKPMKLINQAIPKAKEPMKLLIASLFEGIKECEMIIDRDFKTAYDEIYNNHQDTDGDKASNYSCMSGNGTEAENFYGLIDGCYVVRWQTKDGEQVGRCIMYEWEGKRHFIRIYGKYEYHRTMINMLEAQMKEGDIFGRNKTLEGIKLKTQMDWETPTMYLDGNNYGLKEEDNEWFLVANKYDTDCKTTSGDTLADLLDCTSVCEHCGRRRPNDDGTWVNDCFYCCESCAYKDGWETCERCGEWMDEDDGIKTDSGERYCCENCARNAGYGYDSFYTEWVPDEDLGPTDDGEYNTTREGAAEYYNIDVNQVRWDCVNSCWGKTEEQEQTENDGE